ncbi:dentin sialophosphoprotein-like [Schistocerca nitens]|uniref:dentin sialophosphoprotein-like n=1 Tax=Schistocerca nitens TaxID=7011 RepID=UPI002118181E|nr:dentin sialophosphoprotein-like [Schistocerca nitens]
MLLSLPRERLHSSSSTSSSSSSTSSEACQDSEDEGAVTAQVAAGCYTVTAGGDSDESGADSDASETTSTSSGGEFSKVFVVNSGGDDDDSDSSDAGLPEAPAQPSSGGSDAEGDESGAVVLLRHASFGSDEKAAERGRDSSLRQNKEETVVCGGKKTNRPTALSELASPAGTEGCDDGIVLLKHIKKSELETATGDASRHSDSKGKESEGDGIVLVKHVKNLEGECADVSARASDFNSVPGGVVSDGDKDVGEEESGGESEGSVSEEMQMHHDTGDSSDSDSDSSTFSTSGCDSDLDSGDGGVVLLRHIEVVPEEDRRVRASRGDVNECGTITAGSVVSEGESNPVGERKDGVETEDRVEEATTVEKATEFHEGECKVPAVEDETGGENNDAVLAEELSGSIDDLAVNDDEGNGSVMTQEATAGMQEDEQGAEVVTLGKEDEGSVVAEVSSGSGEGPQEPEVTTERPLQTQDEQKPPGHAEDGGDSAATQDTGIPTLEEEGAAKESDLQQCCPQITVEVVECIEDMTESIVTRIGEDSESVTVTGDERLAGADIESAVAETGQLEDASGSVTEDSDALESAVREGIREGDEDKAAAAAGSDPALTSGRADNYDGRAAARSSPERSEMAPAAAAAASAPRAAATHDTEEGVRNTCISLAALFGEYDSASLAVCEDEVSAVPCRADSADSTRKEVAVAHAEVDTIGAEKSGASAAAEVPVDSATRVGESAAEMTWREGGGAEFHCGSGKPVVGGSAREF